MEARLIDANATKEKLGFAIEPFIGSAAAEIRNDTLLKAIAIVDSMPTVDAQPVKHGKWEQSASGELYCCYCQYVPQWEDDRFCANCGAELWRETDETDNNREVNDVKAG